LSELHRRIDDLERRVASTESLARRLHRYHVEATLPDNERAAEEVLAWYRRLHDTRQAMRDSVPASPVPDFAPDFTSWGGD
jgi:uncharacterized coiled-coil protein SlyX